MGRYVKPVRVGGKMYLYLVEVTTENGKRQQKMIQRVNEDEARQLGWVPDKSDESRTAQVASSPAPGTQEVDLAEAPPPKESDEKPPDNIEEGFVVIERSGDFYVLEPAKPNLVKGYVIVTEEGRVFCGVCPGFACVHVKLMHNWLRTHRDESA